MMDTVELAERKKRLLEESYVMIERLKKLRALNCNPRFVGINPRLERALGRKR
jgi:hypothetical protein